METIKQAKRLHEMGFAVLWLYPKSKRPIGDEWQKGERKDWKQLEKEYKKAMNVGVRLGSPSKFSDGSYLCVLDCDVKSTDPVHLKEMERALMGFCPSHEFAPRVLSGRGGGSCHFYFRTKNPQQSFKALRSGHKVKVFMPSAEPSKADKDSLTDAEIKAGYRMRLAWEVDVFGEGKQVVLPPSTHPDTMRPYEWEIELRDYEAIPLHTNFSPTKVRLVKDSKKEIKFSHVDLFSTPISDKYFDLISSGKGFERYPSRSEALFASLNAMIYAGLSDDQIYYVLTDPSNFMSEKPLEAGRGDPEASARWIQTQIAKIRAELDASDLFKDEAVIDDLDEILALTEEEAQAQEDELVHWVSRLERNKAGYKNTAYNLYLILRNLSANDPANQCVFAYDEFNLSSIYTFPPPWGDKTDVGRELTDLDDTRIQTWLSKEWGIETGEQRIASLTYQLSKENAFHPVHRYLKGLKWDGKERLNSLLSKYCGAVGDSRYLADAGRKFLTAAVARVFDPGIKFDHVLILEGPQGVGKSSFVRLLAGKWYSDSLGEIGSKDVIDNMRGKWIIELGELASMNKAESNELKAFVSRQTDVARKAYGRRSQEYPRQCVFIGTTNDDEYLRDATGARRFWPVQTTNIDLQGLARDRDQIWAEAYVNYQLGEALFLEDNEVRKYAEGEQADRFIVDEIQTQVKKIIEDKDFPEKFSFDDVWARLAILEGKTVGKSCDYPTQVRIKKAIRVLNYPKIRVRIEGERAYLWAKKLGKYKTY